MLKVLSSLLMLVAIPLITQQPENGIANDRTHRDSSIVWPTGFDPLVAPVFSHNEISIDINCHRAFSRLADAPDWPNWLILTKDVTNETAGPVQKGTLIRLKIFNSPIEARIVEFVPDQRMGWIPFGADETETRHSHFHAWHFIPTATGCRVVTEETGVGPGDIKDPAKGSRLMHRAHDLWLASLKWTSEQ